MLVKVHCVMQRGVYDFVALSLGVVASARPSANRLFPTPPPSKLCRPINIILLFETQFVASMMYWGCIKLLLVQDWYKGGNGSSNYVRCLRRFPACMSTNALSFIRVHRATSQCCSNCTTTHPCER